MHCLFHSRSLWPRRCFFLPAVCAVMTCTGFSGVPRPLEAQTCKARLFEGEVRRGQSWQHAIAPDLDVKLEAVPAGWMVRVLPRHGSRPPHDAAELANPPYRSPSPLLVSTDFAFRAQDAIAWNPRTFHFFTSSGQTSRAEEIYQATLRDPVHPGAGAALYPLLTEAPEATLTLLDAEIVGGTANQTAAAATVASHLEQTAHRVRQDSPSALGKLLSLRFRFQVPSLTRGCSPSGAAVLPRKPVQ